MDDEPLRVFAINETPISLRTLRDALRKADCPVGIGVGLAGEASAEELDAPDWDAAFVRWSEPELHEVYLLERDAIGGDEQVDAIVAHFLQVAQNRPQSGGQMLVIDHLRRTRTLYSVQLLPALLMDDDHLAWRALDVLLREIAQRADGVIYAANVGFYDADGEGLLAESDDLEEDEDDETDEDE